MVVNRDGANALLAVLQTAIKAGGSLGATKLGLFQADIVPTPNTPLVDLVEADYDGYAQKTLTWTIGPYFNPGNQSELQNTSQNWTPTGSTTPNTIYGYFVLSAAGALLWAERFDTPRVLDGATTTLTLLPTLVLVPGGLSAIVQPQDS